MKTNPLSAYEMGKWLLENHGKSFCIATPDGFYNYKPTFEPCTSLRGREFDMVFIDEVYTPTKEPDPC